MNHSACFSGKSAPSHDLRQDNSSAPYPQPARNPSQRGNEGATKSASLGAATKRCPRCGETKAAHCFAKRGDRLQPYCRPCAAAKFAEWLARDGNRERLNRATAASQRRHPERKRAASLVRQAILRGDLTPGPCAVGTGCRGRIEAHHPDYSKPLEVQWLCRHHHDALHHPVEVAA